MPNWNQEIKLSDLFKRGAKAPKEQKPAKDEKPAGDAADAGQTEAAGRASFLKKDVKLSLRRGSKEPKAPKEPKERRKREKAPKAEQPKRPKAPKQPKASRSAKPAALPQIPLMRAFDLLPKEDTRQTGGRRPSTAQLILAVVALVAIAGLGTAFLLLSGQVADKEREYNALRGRLASLNAPQQKPQAQPDEGDQVLIDERNARTSALAAALGTRVAWDRLLRDVSLVLPEDVWLDKLTAKGPAAAPVAGGAPAPAAPGSAGASSFTITGYTYEQESVAQVLSRLSVIPELSSVQLVSSARAVVGGKDVVQFSISATVKTAGGATA